jgi:hypothetical protein
MSGGARERGWLVVAHHHPGRLRVRSPRFELDERLLEATQRWLAEHPGVRGACSDATAGSILLAYDPSRTDVGELLVAIASRARLVIVEREPREAPAKRIFGAVRALDGLVLDASGGRFGLGLVFPTALGLGSIASFVMSPHVRAPRWDNLLWWGIQAFRAFNADQHPPARPHATGS